MSRLYSVPTEASQQNSNQGDQQKPPAPIVFHFGDYPIRTITIDDEPWWVAKDVCDALCHSNSRVALSRLDDDEKGVSSTYTSSGTRRVAIINEPGLYHLIMSSRKPEAKAFSRWVRHEVLPELRRTGTYSASQTPAQGPMSGLLSSAILRLVGEPLAARVRAYDRLDKILTRLAKQGVSERDILAWQLDAAEALLGHDVSAWRAALAQQPAQMQLPPMGWIAG